MRYVVFFKGYEDLMGEYFEEEQVRGIGGVYVYRKGDLEIILIPSHEDFRYKASEWERKLKNSLGLLSGIVVLIKDRETTLYTPGNPTNSNPILHPSFSPRTLAPADGDVIGSILISLWKAGIDAHLVAVHDPPVNVSYPTLTLTFVDMDVIIPPIIAALRKKRVFLPYITVSREYRARYFYNLFKKRYISAYHIPYYWKHFLDSSLYEQAVEKGRVRGILVERGLDLPSELSYKEV